MQVYRTTSAHHARACVNNYYFGYYKRIIILFYFFWNSWWKCHNIRMYSYYIRCRKIGNRIIVIIQYKIKKIINNNINIKKMKKIKPKFKISGIQIVYYAVDRYFVFFFILIKWHLNTFWNVIAMFIHRVSFWN